jgi:hypothetical protein
MRNASFEGGSFGRSGHLTCAGERTALAFGSAREVDRCPDGERNRQAVAWFGADHDFDRAFSRSTVSA